MTATNHRRTVIGVALVGLVLTVAATVIPYGNDAIADHLRDGYPSYSQSRIDDAVATYLAYLTGLGVLGVIAWIVTVWAVEKGKRWVRGAATTFAALGASIALYLLLVKDTSGDTGLPASVSLLGLLPAAVGLVLVGLLWSRPAP